MTTDEQRRGRILTHLVAGDLTMDEAAELLGVLIPHEAPVSDFPKQPSRKDGLGVMCTEHWRAYVKGLREARGDAATSAEGTARGGVRRPTPRS